MPQVNENCLKIGARSCLFLPTHHGAKECALTCQMSYVERNFHSACAFSSCHFSRYYYFYLSDGNLGAQKNIKSLAQRYTAKRQHQWAPELDCWAACSSPWCAASRKSGWRFWEAVLAIQGQLGPGLGRNQRNRRVAGTCSQVSAIAWC